jgi:hypothetical protein
MRPRHGRRPGVTLRITITQPGHIAERAELRIRAAKLPSVLMP